MLDNPDKSSLKSSQFGAIFNLLMLVNFDMFISLRYNRAKKLFRCFFAWLQSLHTHNKLRHTKAYSINRPCLLLSPYLALLVSFTHAKGAYRHSIIQPIFFRQPKHNSPFKFEKRPLYSGIVIHSRYEDPFFSSITVKHKTQHKYSKFN